MASMNPLHQPTVVANATPGHDGLLLTKERDPVVINNTKTKRFGWLKTTAFKAMKYLTYLLTLVALVILAVRVHQDGVQYDNLNDKYNSLVSDRLSPATAASVAGSSALVTPMIHHERALSAPIPIETYSSIVGIFIPATGIAGIDTAAPSETASPSATSAIAVPSPIVTEAPPPYSTTTISSTTFATVHVNSTLTVHATLMNVTLATSTVTPEATYTPSVSVSTSTSTSAVDLTTASTDAISATSAELSSTRSEGPFVTVTATEETSSTITSTAVATELASIHNSFSSIHPSTVSIEDVSTCEPTTVYVTAYITPSELCSATAAELSTSSSTSIFTTVTSTITGAGVATVTVTGATAPVFSSVLPSPTESESATTVTDYLTIADISASTTTVIESATAADVSSSTTTVVTSATYVPLSASPMTITTTMSSIHVSVTVTTITSSTLSLPSAPPYSMTNSTISSALPVEGSTTSGGPTAFTTISATWGVVPASTASTANAASTVSSLMIVATPTYVPVSGAKMGVSIPMAGSYFGGKNGFSFCTVMLITAMYAALF